MKKILFNFLPIAAVGLAVNIFGQNNTAPVPTTSSFQNYINAGISPATGIPSINIPIYKLESSDTGFPIAVSLSYHPYNALEYNPAGEVGSGWTLFKGGSISRMVIGNVDESKSISDITEREADIFYYAIPGFSGKFNIHKSDTGNNLVINNISGTKVKIEFTRDMSNTKLVINSFKITDDKGYQYFFNDHNIGTYSSSSGTKNYSTAFELNQVKDAGNHEIINFIYDKKIKYIGASTTMKYQSCKLKDIITSKGKISFTFDYDPAEDGKLNPENDPYSVKNIVLTDNQGTLISKYELEYGLVETNHTNSYGNFIIKRSLTSVSKIGRDLAPYEKTGFEYRDLYNTPSGPSPGTICSSDSGASNSIKGILRKITFPTQGYLIYEFEANELYVDKSSLNYTGYNYIADPAVQYYGETVIPYNTANSLTYTFQVTGNAGTLYPVYLENASAHDGIITDPSQQQPVITFNVKNSAGVVMSRNSAVDCNNPNYSLYPGIYTISTNNPPDDGVFRLHQIVSKPLPYPNALPEYTGARIKTIRSYDSDGTLLKTKRYEYNSFSDPLSSTGFIYDAEMADPNFLSISRFVLYKNVKETEVSGMQTNGSVRYTFRIPEDYRDVGGNYRFYNLTSQALIEKKEILNNNGQLQEKAEYEYTLSKIPGSSGHALTPSYSYIPGFIQATKETGTVNHGSSSQVTINEVTVRPDNFQVSSSKVISQDGSVAETITRYAADLGNTRLTNANMISVPLQVETRTDGTLMGRVTTKYESNDHLYPTSLETTDLNQATETRMTFDLYDDRGNLVQSTDKSGNSVTTIWGYNHTLPIAIVNGAKYSEISSLAVITAAVDASDADASNPANEGNLVTALNNIRLSPQLQEYAITVNTFDPLIGITHTVSPGGLMQSYQYDAAARLQKVKNSDGQLIKENLYNYKH